MDANDLFGRFWSESFLPDFADELSVARDNDFEKGEDKSPYHLQGLTDRIWCDRTHSVLEVFAKHAGLYVEQFTFPSPITVNDVESILGLRWLGVPFSYDHGDHDTMVGMVYGCATLLAERIHCVDIDTMWGGEDVDEERYLGVLEIAAPKWLLHDYELADEGLAEAFRLREQGRHARFEEQMRELKQKRRADPAGVHSGKHPAPGEDDAAKQTGSPTPTDQPTEESSGEPMDYLPNMWEAENGAAISLVPVPATHEMAYVEGGDAFLLKAMLSGYFTPDAAKAATAKLRPIVELLLKLLPLAVQGATKDERFASLVSPDSRAFFQAGVDLLLQESFAEDDLDQRLYNAYRMLQLEAETKNHRLALSLSFAAMESLLTTTGPGSTGELKVYLAALLQPDPEKRKGAQKEIVKLYDIRNEVAHGRVVAEQESDHEMRGMARTLAAGVIMGVIQVRTHFKKTGASLTLKKLHSELIMCAREDAEMVGTDKLGRFIPSNIPKRKPKPSP